MLFQWKKPFRNKEALLLGVSLAALAYNRSAIADTDVNGADTTLAADETGSVVFTTDNSLTVSDGVSIAGNVDNGGGGAATGYLVFSGSSTVGGTVGATNTLNTITAGATSSTVQFLGSVQAADINFSSDGTISLATGTSVSGTISATVSGSGTVTLEGANTLGGDVGAAGNTVAAVTAGVTGTSSQLSGDVFATAVEIQSDGTVQLDDGKSISGAITAATGNSGNGYVQLLGDNTVTGDVGASALTIGTLAGGANTKITQLDGDVYATTVLFDSAGTISLSDGKSITGAITNTADTEGELTFAGSGTVTGDIGGAANNLSSINVGVSGSTVQLQGDAFAAAVNFTTDGTLSLATGKSITGALTFTDTASAVVTFEGDNTVTGDVGAAGNILGTLQAGVTGTSSQLAGDTFATNVELQSDGTLTLDTGKSITGAVTAATGNSGNGTLTFSGANTVTGDIGATGLTIGTVSTGVTATSSQLAGDVYATTIELASDGTIQLDDGKSITGTISAATGNSANGYVQLLGDNTVTGDIGASGLVLGTVAGGANGKTTQLSGDVFATQLLFDSAGTITLADGKSISGAVTNAADGEGDLNLLGSNTVTGNIGGAGNALAVLSAGVTGGTAQLDGDVFAATVTLGAGTTTLTGTAQSITGATTLAAGGTLSIGTSAVNLAGTGTFVGNATGTISIGITSDTTFGAITAAGNVDLANGLIFVDTSGLTSGITSGTDFTIIDDTAATLSNADVTVTDNSAVLSFTASSTTANTVVLTATRVSTDYTSAAPTSFSNTSGMGTALTNLGSGATGSMATLISTLDNMSATTLGTTLNQLLPASATASTAAVNSVGTQVSNATGNRLASLSGHGNSNTMMAYNDGKESGVSTGDGYSRRGVWVQGLGSLAKQDKNKNTEEYDATTWGMAIGADTLITDKFRLGLALGYAQTALDQGGTQVGSGVDIDSYVAQLYGNYFLSDAWFLDGTATFGWHNYDTVRTVTAVNGSARGSHNGQQYAARIGTGYNLNLGGATLTPFGSMEYSYLNEEGYTESGTAGVPLKVDSRNSDALKIGGGARLSAEYKTSDNFRLRPSVKAAVYEDVLAGAISTTATFVGGGAAFTTRSDKPASTSYNLGVGLSILSAADTSVDFTYDTELKEKYIDHTGSLRVRLAF